MSHEQEFVFKLSKCFEYDELKTEKEINAILEQHVEHVKEALSNRIPNIVYCLTREYVWIYDYDLSFTTNLILNQHSKSVLHIPGITSKKYNNYQQEIKIKLHYHLLRDLNIIKLKSFNVYQQCFDIDGGLNINVIFTIKHTLEHLKYDLKC